jgi:hypothetical protein
LKTYSLSVVNLACCLYVGLGMLFIWLAVKKFLEWRYCTIMVRYMATLTWSPSKWDPCVRTHLLQWPCLCWKHWQKSSFGIFRFWLSHLIWCPPWLRNASPCPFSE